jgi:hypothetical protein
MATPLWQAKTIMATPLWQVWNYCNSTLANQDRPNLSFLSHSILQTPFSSATPVRRTGQQTYRLVLQRIDYMFPLFLSVNKSLLKGQILIYLFYHHLATHLRISFSTPEEILTVKTRALPPASTCTLFVAAWVFPKCQYQDWICFLSSPSLSLSPFLATCYSSFLTARQTQRPYPFR